MSLHDNFMNAPRAFSLMPFWFLNDALTEDELRRQIDDFEAHGVYGFIPHARLGLPDSIGFMSDAWLHYIKVCVDHAAARNMTVILYDEGMYPSGSCAGQVAAANPCHAARCILRRPRGPLAEGEELIAEDDAAQYVHAPSRGTIRGVHYGQDDGEPAAPLAADILNPEATASFRRLVLDRYYDVLKDHFGKTVVGVFTDEPDVLGRRPLKDARPWTHGFEDCLKKHLGYDFRPRLAALWDDAYPDARRYRRDFYRAVNARLEAAYYAPYSQWCQDHGVALTGHPAKPDDIGLLRHFHIPGQDIVWRYIEPYKDNAIEGPQSTMAKCAASAQRHYRRARCANECFGAYGWEFTYDEMRYITNWLFVRGVNLLMPHAFYYSLRDKRRDERPPDVGPNSPWWGKFKPYADYCRRMSWLIAKGRPECPFAILGRPDALPWRAARAMFETQHDFLYLDTITLFRQLVRSDVQTVTPERVIVEGMRYEVLIADGGECLDDSVLDSLAPMVDSGRVIAFGEPIPGIPRHAPDAAALGRMLDLLVFPDVVTNPALRELRYTHLFLDGAHAYVFVNEGPETIDVQLVTGKPPKEWWNPWTGSVSRAGLDRLALPPLGVRVLIA